MTFPNILTGLRIVLTPVFLALIFSDSGFNKILALLVFTVASLTDFFDGWFARRDKTVTSLGRFMDPLADKLLVSSALISFVLLGMVEAWLVGAMLFRDAVITCLRGVRDPQGTSGGHVPAGEMEDHAATGAGIRYPGLHQRARDYR